MAIDTVDNLPGSVPAPVHVHVDTIDIDAPVSQVWGMVTALDRHGEWSSENTGGRWRRNEDGADGTGQVGDKFVGVNRLDGVEWKALVEVIARVENQDFAFVTGGLEHNIALWRYQLEPTATGTRVTESWTLRELSPAMVEKGESEFEFRQHNAETSIRATLEALKAAAEAS